MNVQIDPPSFDTRAEDQQIVDSLISFVDKEIMPIQAKIQPMLDDQRLYYDARGQEVPEITNARREARMKSAEAGFYTMFCAKEFGGADLGVRLWFLCWEALFHRYGAPPKQLPYFILSHFTGGPHEVWTYASDSLKAEVIPDLAAGKLQGAFGLSEPDAGSDSWMMQTKAVRDGDDWIINGMKQWTSYSPTADFIMVYAVTDKEMVAQKKGGITCFYVPTTTPGYKLESIIKVFGHIGGHEGILSFTDVRVPDRYRVGELHKGFDLAMLGVRHGRMANAGRGLGQARWALDKAIEYAKIRKTFGKTLAEHQGIQNYLAEAVTKLYAGHAMAMDCGRKIDEGRDMRAEVSMLKLYCTRSAFEIIDTCMQIHGGMGLVNETHLIEAWHNTRMTHMTEGSNEIQLRQIAQRLLKGQIDLGFT